MVNFIRVKNYEFVLQFSGTTTANFYSDNPINGEILEVHKTYGAQGATGSFTICASGTQEGFYTNIVPSGAGIQVRRPYALPTTAAGVILGTGSQGVPYVVNDKIVVQVIAGLSGTSPTRFNVLYR